MKNFIDLTYEEKKMVLSWRNDVRIRNNMYFHDEIALENHLTFIDRLSYDKENEYFLVDDIGVIYFNNIKNNQAEIGLYSNPQKYGVGDLLMQKILSFDFKLLYLEVINSNKKAINLYLKHNFKIISEKIIDNKHIICMELNNENR